MPPNATRKRAGRATPKKKNGAAKVAKLTIPGMGVYVIPDDYTARLADRCRREMGATPEQMIREMTRAEDVSVDTVARLIAFARWHAGDDVTFDELLDALTMSQAARATLELVDAADPEVVDNPE